MIFLNIKYRLFKVSFFQKTKSINGKTAKKRANIPHIPISILKFKYMKNKKLENINHTLGIVNIIFFLLYKKNDAITTTPPANTFKKFSYEFQIKNESKTVNNHKIPAPTANFSTTLIRMLSNIILG